MDQWIDPKPVIRPVRMGYLANTPATFPYRIAVIARTEAEARCQFELELCSWKELQDRLVLSRQSLAVSGL